MSIYAVAGATIEAVLQAAETGKVGTYRVSIIDTPTSSYWLNPTTSGIVEVPTGSAVYAWTGTAPATVGAYTVVWDAGTNSQVLAVEDLIITQSGVQPSSPSAGDLCTVADVRQALELPVSDTTRNTLIQSLITELSKAITVYCSRQFSNEGTQSSTKRFQLASGSTFLDLDPYDLRSASALTVKLNPEETGGGTTLTVTRDFQLTPVQPRDTFMGIRMNPDVSGLHNSDTARNFGYTLVDVTSASWGFGAVPADVRHACIVAVAANLDRRLDAFGAVQDLVDPDAGIQPLRAASFAIPTASMAVLAPYRRHVGVF